MVDNLPVQCGGCRLNLLSTAEHPLLDAHSYLLHSGTADTGNVCASNQVHNNLYLDEEKLPEFVHEAVMQSNYTTGRLKCPKCGARLGAFNFVKSSRCSCGAHMLPPVHLTFSKVDYRGYALSGATLSECSSTILASPASAAAASEALLNADGEEEEDSSTPLLDSAVCEPSHSNLVTSVMAKEIDEIDSFLKEQPKISESNSHLKNYFTEIPSSNSESMSDQSDWMYKSISGNRTSFCHPSVAITTESSQDLPSDNSEPNPAHRSSERSCLLSNSAGGLELPEVHFAMAGLHATARMEDVAVEGDVDTGVNLLCNSCMKGKNCSITSPRVIHVLDNIFSGSGSDGATVCSSSSNSASAVACGNTNYTGSSTAASAVTTVTDTGGVDYASSNTDEDSVINNSVSDCSSSSACSTNVTATIDSLESGHCNENDDEDACASRASCIASNSNTVNASGRDTDVVTNACGTSDCLNLATPCPAIPASLGVTTPVHSSLTTNSATSCSATTTMTPAPSSATPYPELVDYPDHLVCPICLELLFSPFSVKPCGHVFCEPCLRRLARPAPTNTACPLCREIIGACQPAAEYSREVRQKFPKQVAERHKFEQNNSAQHLPLPWLQNYRFLNFDSGPRHARTGVYTRYSNWWRTALWIFWVDAIGFLLILTLNWFLTQNLHGGEQQQLPSPPHLPLGQGPKGAFHPAVILDGSGDGGGGGRSPSEDEEPWKLPDYGSGEEKDGRGMASTDYLKYRKFHSPHTVKPIQATTYAPAPNENMPLTKDLPNSEQGNLQRKPGSVSDHEDKKKSLDRIFKHLYSSYDNFGDISDSSDFDSSSDASSSDELIDDKGILKDYLVANSIRSKRLPKIRLDNRINHENIRHLYPPEGVRWWA